MSVLDEIRLLIKECVDMPDGLGNPIISKLDADRYIRYLEQTKEAIRIFHMYASRNWDKVYYTGHCPVCNFDQTEGKSVDIDGGTATQDCHCLKCNAQWTNTYTLRETTITWTISQEQST